MKQITLEEWDQVYAESVNEVLPANDEEVFFKTIAGDIVKGWYISDSFGFDSCEDNWSIDDDVIEWHPVKVDM
jgi:hypothetical protein